MTEHTVFVLHGVAEVWDVFGRGQGGQECATVMESEHPPSSIEPSTPIVPPVATATVACPRCDATLQKVVVTPGVRINCLHCGARFFPTGSPEAAQTSFPRAPSPGKPSAREPGSPGYWLLRIPAAALCVAGIFITALIAWTELRPLPAPTVYFWVYAAFVPLIPLAGLLAVFWTRSLARVDAGAARLLWKSGLLTEPLPGMRGSSLPYIGPLAITGGLLPLFRYIYIESTAEELIRGAIPGVVLFLAGFMAEDLRQFIWRQRCIAEQLAKQKSLDDRWPLTTIRWTAWACVFGFGCLTMCELLLAYKTGPDGYNRVNFILYVSLALVFGGLAVTGSKLSADWDVAATQWSRLAARLDQQPEPRMTGLILRLAFFPLAWGVYSFCWMCHSIWSMRRDAEVTAALWLIGFGAIGASIWVSCMLRQSLRWRAGAQRVFASLRGDIAVPPKAPSIKGWLSALFYLSLLLAAIQATIMAYMIYYEATRYGRSPEWRIIWMIPLAATVCTYPTVWCAMIFRDFIVLEQDLGRRLNSDPV